MERLRRIAIDLFLMVAIGVLLGLLAPFGSAAMPAGPRLFFWVGFIVAGYLIFRPVSAVAGWVREETRVPAWLAVVLTAAVASLPLASLIAFALGRMQVGEPWFGSRFPFLYGQVATVGIAIHLLMMLLFQAPAPAARAEEPEPQPAAREDPFLQRLPPHVRGDLVCLEMQDHYVRAETALGSALILMRFRDAVAELGDAGMQVHRSWWAAFDAMEELEREGRGVRLRLRGGRTLPVSRAWLPAVRERVRLRFDSGAPDLKSPGEAARSARGTVPGAVP